MKPHLFHRFVPVFSHYDENTDRVYVKVCKHCKLPHDVWVNLGKPIDTRKVS